MRSYVDFLSESAQTCKTRSHGTDIDTHTHTHTHTHTETHIGLHATTAGAYTALAYSVVRQKVTV